MKNMRNALACRLHSNLHENIIRKSGTSINLSHPKLPLILIHMITPALIIALAPYSTPPPTPPPPPPPQHTLCVMYSRKYGKFVKVFWFAFLPFLPRTPVISSREAIAFTSSVCVLSRPANDLF